VREDDIQDKLAPSLERNRSRAPANARENNAHAHLLRPVDVKARKGNLLSEARKPLEAQRNEFAVPLARCSIERESAVTDALALVDPHLQHAPKRLLHVHAPHNHLAIQLEHPDLAAPLYAHLDAREQLALPSV
jgi:hypothetical protein